METRVKLFKQYRLQIKKEAAINKKLLEKNKDIQAIKKKVSKITDLEFSDEGNEFSFSKPFFVEPKMKKTLNEMEYFINSLNIDKLDDEFKEIYNKNKFVDDIIDKKGMINPEYFANDETFLNITNLKKNIKDFNSQIDDYNILMKDNINKENEIFCDIKSNPDSYKFFNIKKKEYKKTDGWRYSKILFCVFSFLCLVLLIVLLVVLFI